MFVRTYSFLATVLPYSLPEWEYLATFFNFLIPKLPAPKEDDLSKGILETVDMDSYRVEKQAAQRVQLSDQDAEIDPVPADGGGHKAEPELDRLSNIIRSFNDLFGNITWADTDRIRRGGRMPALRFHCCPRTIPESASRRPGAPSCEVCAPRCVLSPPRPNVPPPINALRGAGAPAQAARADSPPATLRRWR